MRIKCLYIDTDYSSAEYANEELNRKLRHENIEKDKIINTMILKENRITSESTCTNLEKEIIKAIFILYFTDQKEEEEELKLPKPSAKNERKSCFYNFCDNPVFGDDFCYKHAKSNDSKIYTIKDVEKILEDRK